MDWLTALVEIIKAAAWPGVIVFLGWYFKPQIVEVSGHMGEILPRLKRAWLLEFFEPILQRQRADDTPSAPEHPLTQLPAVSLPIQKVEEAIRRDLEKLPADQKQDALVRVLAQTQLAQFFENTYGLIFGTQISGLRRLAGSAVTIDEAKSFFQESVVARYPKYFREASFEKWLSFLLERELAKKDHQTVSITDLGRVFLNYLSARQLPENKPL